MTGLPQRTFLLHSKVAKKEKCFSSSTGCKVYQPLKLRLLSLFTSCEPAFLSKDVKQCSSETVHTDVYKIEESFIKNHYKEYSNS